MVYPINTFRRHLTVVLVCLSLCVSLFGIKSSFAQVPANGEAKSADTSSPIVPTCEDKGISPPVALNSHGTSMDDYPSLSISQNEQGDVVVSFIIESNGAVTDSRVAMSSGYTRLDDAAAALVKRWRYNPAKQNGSAIRCNHMARVSWRLQNVWNTIIADPSLYPPDAKASGEEGSTLFRVSLDEKGTVLYVTLLSSSGYPEFDRAGYDIIRNTKFFPAQINSVAAQSELPIEVRWALSHDR